MSVDTWIALASLALFILGVAVRLERRMGKALTRDEHERICQARSADVQKSLDELRGDMERRHEENRETLQEIKDAVTGTHKRMDEVLFKMLGRST